jgi:replicative DNA helicase
VPTLFLSHASEDKVEVARPLAAELIRMGFNVWFDEYTLTLGDNLRRSIDEGLSKCDYGVVILSRMFFEKDWPQQELDGLVIRELRGRKLISPVWHRVTKTDIERYSPILANRLAVSTDKGLHNVVEEITRAVSRDNNSVRLAESGALERLSSVADEVSEARPADPNVSAKEAVMNAIEFIEKLYESTDGAMPGSLSSGLRDFDRMTRGLRPGQLIAILGVPSSGKSSLAIGIARHCVFNNGQSVLFGSEQLDAAQVMLRVLASAADVSLARILNGYLREKDFPNLTAAAAKLAGSRFEITDETPMSLESLGKRAAEIKHGGALDLLIIDHLDSLPSVRTARMDEREVVFAKTMSTLKDLAQRLQIPVIFVATLRPHVKPGPGSSGITEFDLDYVIQRDADVVAIISIGSPYEEDQEITANQRATLRLVKNPFGVGEIPLHWNKDSFRFADWGIHDRFEDDKPSGKSSSTRRKRKAN